MIQREISFEPTNSVKYVVGEWLLGYGHKRTLYYYNMLSVRLHIIVTVVVHGSFAITFFPVKDFFSLGTRVFRV